MNAVQQKKVYDYKPEVVRTGMMSALRKKKGEATLADIIAATGLPKYQVETEMPALIDEYQGRLRVTDSGELLYSFPRGYTSRYKGFGVTIKKIFKGLKQGLKAVGTFVFKTWIMLMLVGYFFFFIALALLAIFASFAGGGKSSNSKSRGSGGGGFIAFRLIEAIVRIWFYSELFKSPQEREAERYRRSEARQKKRPLHKAVFSFVFGEEDINKNHDEVIRQLFAAMVRAKKGIILMEDFISLTGLAPEEAERTICRYLYEFEGTPEVSEEGTIYYDFSKLLVRLDSDRNLTASSSLKALQPFSANNASTNVLFAAMNGVNLLFGGYFLYQSVYALPSAKSGLSYLYYFTYRLMAELGAMDPASLVFWALGIVPLVFSVVYWVVPILRNLGLSRHNEGIKIENARRLLYTRISRSTEPVDASVFRDAPAHAVPSSISRQRLLDETAVYERADFDGQGRLLLTDYARRYADVEKLRASKEVRGPGNVVFDSES